VATGKQRAASKGQTEWPGGVAVSPDGHNVKPWAVSVKK
jgi:hypothetical protein